MMRGLLMQASGKLTALGLFSTSIIFFLCAPFCYAEKKPERHYQGNFCRDFNGVIEYRLADGTRADCLTSTHVIEVDFAKKWYEAIGQSLFYSVATGKHAGIALILLNDKDYRYWIRLNTTIEYHALPIKAWIIKDY
ncbi:MAG: hypothetical protein PSN46_09430 [Gammaproteobacteria bacterium]|nr:hypothetical protein [Gammaproteobacteria bacterium]